MISNQDGFYTRTQAYNFLKELLGVSKSVLINKSFFLLFFSESDGGMYVIKKPEDMIKNIFTEEGIVEMNKMYFQKKQEKQLEEANEISQKVRMVVVKKLAA